MKKFIISFISAIIVGIILGSYIFLGYQDKIVTVDKVESDKTIYILQQGVYSSLENAKKYAPKEYYITHHDDKYYRVYVGISANLENANKLKEFFINKGNNIYIRELVFNNKEFDDLINQYDLLISKINGEEMISIQKQILDKYKELVIKDDD